MFRDLGIWGIHVVCEMDMDHRGQKGDVLGRVLGLGPYIFAPFFTLVHFPFHDKRVMGFKIRKLS